MRGKDTLGTGSWDTGTLGACRIAEWGLALTAGGSQGTPAHHSPARARGGHRDQGSLPLFSPHCVPCVPGHCSPRTRRTLGDTVLPRCANHRRPTDRPLLQTAVIVRRTIRLFRPNPFPRAGAGFQGADASQSAAQPAPGHFACCERTQRRLRGTQEDTEERTRDTERRCVNKLGHK